MKGETSKYRILRHQYVEILPIFVLFNNKCDILAYIYPTIMPAARDLMVKPKQGQSLEKTGRV